MEADKTLKKYAFFPLNPAWASKDPSGERPSHTTNNIALMLCAPFYSSLDKENIQLM
jgi:hypothetical protein